MGTWNWIFRYTQNLLKREKGILKQIEQGFLQVLPKFLHVLHLGSYYLMITQVTLLYTQVLGNTSIWPITNVVGMFGYHKTKTLYVSVDSSHNLVFYTQYYILFLCIVKSFNSVISPIFFLISDLPIYGNHEIHILFTSVMTQQFIKIDCNLWTSCNSWHG